ncbi:hypothetical protein WMF38_57130 [Sorangium sp. So ce118]
MNKLTKVTEVTATYNIEEEAVVGCMRDGEFWPVDRHLVPEEAIGKSGRWRIAVEFEPEDA